VIAQPRERHPALRAAVPATGKVPDHLEPGQMRVIPPPRPRPRAPLVPAPARAVPPLPAAARAIVTGGRLRARALRGAPEQHPLQNRQVSPQIPQLRSLLRNASQLIIDLSAVEHVDASGLAVLVGSGHRARLLGGSLLLAAPSPEVARVLSATGINQHLDIFPTVRAAITGQRLPEAIFPPATGPARGHRIDAATAGVANRTVNGNSSWLAKDFTTAGSDGASMLTATI